MFDNKLKIPIQTEIERFEKHLETNNRILFSGIFGIGKTYFLKEFFNKHIDKYDAYFISPVNYSIANNKDIFKYIKFDIASELLIKQPDFEKDYFTLKETIIPFVRNNKVEVLKAVFSNLGKLGKGLKALTELYEKAVEHNEDLNEDEKKQLMEFMKSVSKMEGSLYAEDLIGALISEKIALGKRKDLEAKEDTTLKKAVLIIDDLDRLDPEHIFRILNILAHQVDIENMGDNFYSIDKVIIVGDIDNIRSIFHNRYGNNTNFSGYIDKFFDNEVYYFDNKQFILEKLNEILQSFNYTEDVIQYIDVKKDNVISRVLKEILVDLITNNQLNLRSLLKYNNQTFHIDRFSFRLPGQYHKGACGCNYGQFVIFDFLLKLYGEMAALKKAIYKLAEYGITKNKDDIFIDRCGFLVTLINYKSQKINQENIYINKELNIEIIYKLEHIYRDYSLYVDKIEVRSIGGAQKTNNLPYGQLLKIAFDKYEEIKNSK